MTTFSQLVDDLVNETKRPDLAIEIADYVNQTIREMHQEPTRGNIVFYPANRKELQLIANVEDGFTWDIPDLTIWQDVETFRYPLIVTSPNIICYPRLIAPGRRQNDYDYYVLRFSTYFAFAGYGGLNAPIDVSYFEFPRGLKYYTIAARPASYDLELGWTYLTGIVTDTEKEQARNKVTNWLLLRWPTVIKEGVRAKVYKRLADDVRARTCYSLYSQLRQGVFTSEKASLGGIT